MKGGKNAGWVKGQRLEWSVWAAGLVLFIFLFFLPLLVVGLVSSSNNPEPQENCSRDMCSFWKDRLYLQSLNQPFSADSNLDSHPSPAYAFHPVCSTPNVRPIGTSHLICVKYNFLSFLSPPHPSWHPILLSNAFHIFSSAFHSHHHHHHNPLSGLNYVMTSVIAQPFSPSPWPTFSLLSSPDARMASHL